jgi:hypothetical protein
VHVATPAPGFPSSRPKLGPRLNSASCRGVAVVMAEHEVSIILAAGKFKVTYKPDVLSPTRAPPGDTGSGVDKDAALEF